MAAAQCIEKKCMPADLVEPGKMRDLQTALMRAGQFIPGLRLQDEVNLACRATISASSELRLATLAPDGASIPLTSPWGQMLPVGAGRAPRVTFIANVAAPTELQIELRTSNRPDNFTPDVLLAQKTLHLVAGEHQPVIFDFNVVIDEPRYLFYCLRKNENITVMTSERRVTGILAVTQTNNPHVSNFGAQVPPEDIGVESFEFWCPLRRPDGRNLALTIDPPLAVFAPENIINGIARPTNQPNAWVADFGDPAPTITLAWNAPQTIARIELSFDTDFDHPMETVHWGHPERAMPFCVRHYRICDDAGKIVVEQTDNHQTRNTLVFETPITTTHLQIELVASHGAAPAALVDLRCYAS
jgi:hypothetical protein